MPSHCIKMHVKYIERWQKKKKKKGVSQRKSWICSLPIFCWTDSVRRRIVMGQNLHRSYGVNCSASD